MAVYVDALFPAGRTRAWPYPMACHMYADTSEELDAMAERIGLKPHWKQRPLTPEEHYDLNGSKRKQALESGAAESPSPRHFAELVRRKRQEGRV